MANTMSNTTLDSTQILLIKENITIKDSAQKITINGNPDIDQFIQSIINET